MGERAQMETTMRVLGGGMAVRRVDSWIVALDCDLALVARPYIRKRRADLFRLAAETMDAFDQFTVKVVEVNAFIVRVTVEVEEPEDFERVADFITGRMLHHINTTPGRMFA